MPLLAITPGEPAGIGPEITLKLALQHPDLPLVAVADPAWLSAVAVALGLDIEPVEWRTGAPLKAGQLACLPVQLPQAVTPGSPDPRNSTYVLESLRRAVQLVSRGQADALVTGPVHKAVINQAGIPFSGHTEFLSELAGRREVVMMLAAPGLRVTLVTTHLPLREVPDAITPARLKAAIRITAEELALRFGIERPRLQVLGLNPHAGESGHLGSEDDGIIRPVIDSFRAAGLNIEGPVPADTAFTPPRLAACDAVVAMYHDQGLPVLKHMGFGRAVNITLGLPFIRTSVDHGTALDIAGKGQANADSLYEAARLARELANSRASSPGGRSAPG